VSRREATLSGLESALSAAQDPWQVNSGMTTALGSAASGLTTLNQQIQTACYSSEFAIRASVDSIFTAYRVYWLRVPQTDVIVTADHLGVARQQLGSVAQRLAGLVGSNTQAQSDLAAMNGALSSFDTAMGTIPNLQGPVAAVPSLQPALDMTSDVGAIQAARSTLQNARNSLGQAATDAGKVVTDLGA